MQAVSVRGINAKIVKKQKRMIKKIIPAATSPDRICQSFAVSFGTIHSRFSLAVGPPANPPVFCAFLIFIPPKL